MTELEKAFEAYNEDLIHLQTLYIKYSKILYEQLLRKSLSEGREEQRQEIIEQIDECCNNIQDHVLIILNLLETSQIISVEEINNLNRIHIDSMNSYRYLILKAKSFPEDVVIQNSVKILKQCKDRLQHNIICYNDFLIKNLANVLLLTPNEAIKKSKEEEDNLINDL